MFEVNTFTPHQTGALMCWLVVHRGPCSYVPFLLHDALFTRLTRYFSVLIHPNTSDSYADHTELATWIGKPWPLHVDFLKRTARFGPSAQRTAQNTEIQTPQR